MRRKRRATDNTGEYLWLVSLSDLMILLFVFFVAIFSFTYKRLQHRDFNQIARILTADKGRPAPPIDDIQAKLLKWVVDRNLLTAITLEQKEDALILHIKEKVLFESGAHSLSASGEKLVHEIGKALTKIPAPYRIGIEGHTDDTPIHSPTIADNWELSAKRAHSVLKSLDLGTEQSQRSVIMGYGEMKPIASNRNSDGTPNPTNQLLNRRVTIRIF